MNLHLGGPACLSWTPSVSSLDLKGVCHVWLLPWLGWPLGAVSCLAFLSKCDVQEQVTGTTTTFFVAFLRLDELRNRLFGVQENPPRLDRGLVLFTAALDGLWKMVGVHRANQRGISLTNVTTFGVNPGTPAPRPGPK